MPGAQTPTSRVKRRGFKRAKGGLASDPSRAAEVALGARAFALIGWLVGEDHTPRSSALLLVAGEASR